jgi:guanylate kinase
VTSRPKGEYETDGELFWFLSEEELVSSLDKDEFMEVTTLFVICRFRRSSCIM